MTAILVLLCVILCSMYVSQAFSPSLGSQLVYKHFFRSREKCPHLKAMLVARRGFLEMRERKCDITGRRKNSKAMSVSKSNAHTHREQGVNLHWQKLWWEEGNKFVRLRLAARTIKTIKLKGLQAVAKKHGVNLNKFAISSGTAPKKEVVSA